MATILLVEDEASMRLLTCAKLKHQFTIICAKDGVEALELLERQPVDLIIADVMMPRMDGYTLVQTLRDQGNGIPVLLLTAKQSFEDKRRGFSSGVDDYMTKPVNYEELTWRINALLRRAHIASERRIVIGPVVLDSSTYTVSRGEQVLELPKKEFELLYKLLAKKNGTITVDYVKECLKNHENYPDSLCAHMLEGETEMRKMWQTNASIIYNLDQLEMDICYGPPCQGEYVTYTL